VNGSISSENTFTETISPTNSLATSESTVSRSDETNNHFHRVNYNTIFELLFFFEQTIYKVPVQSTKCQCAWLFPFTASKRHLSSTLTQYLSKYSKRSSTKSYYKLPVQESEVSRECMHLGLWVFQPKVQHHMERCAVVH
jgi:hypothetical protein